MSSSTPSYAAFDAEALNKLISEMAKQSDIAKEWIEKSKQQQGKHEEEMKKAKEEHEKELEEAKKNRKEEIKQLLEHQDKQLREVMKQNKDQNQKLAEQMKKLPEVRIPKLKNEEGFDDWEEKCLAQFSTKEVPDYIKKFKTALKDGKKDFEGASSLVSKERDFDDWKFLDGILKIPGGRFDTDNWWKSFQDQIQNATEDAKHAHITVQSVVVFSAGNDVFPLIKSEGVSQVAVCDSIRSRIEKLRKWLAAKEITLEVRMGLSDQDMRLASAQPMYDSEAHA